MNCYKLNEGIYNKIETILEVPKSKENFSDETFYKSIYGPGTLMNDWYEKRLSTQTQEELTGPNLSENTDSFREPCKTAFPDRKEYFTHIFDSYGLGQELLTDHLGFSYYDNYVTSYDLMFNHLTKGICGPYPRSYFKGRYKPETDLTKIFGNLTQWGLKEKVYKAAKPMICLDNILHSETSNEFVAYDWHIVKKLNDFQSFRRTKVVY